MYSNIVRDTQGVVLGELSFEDGQASLDAALKSIDKDWAAYLSTDMGADVAKVVAVVKTRMSDAEPNITALNGLMAKKDLPGLTDFAKTKLGDTMERVARTGQARRCLAAAPSIASINIANYY